MFLPPGLGPVPPKSVKIADGVVLNSDQIAVFFAAIVVSIVLWVILRRTRLGLQLRATVDRRDLARLRGIDTARSSAIGTIMGTMLAGLAGVLIAPLFNLEPTVFTSLLLVAAAGAVVGGFKSIPLAMLGGILLGVVQSMVAGYVDIGTDLVPGLRASVPFVLLLVGLLVMGRNRSRVAGVVADDTPPANYLSDLPAWRRGLPWLIGTVVFSVWLLGADDFDSSLALKGLALAIVFLSFVVLTGIGGMVSLTQAAFVMGGAFVTSILIGEGIPFLPAALIGGSVAVAGGLIVAMPSLRLGGLPLALATLAMGLLADQMIFQIEEVNGGSLGRELPRPEFFGIDFTDDKKYAFLLLLVFGIGAVAVRNLMRSSTGRSMLALRSSEAGAATSGASPIRLKFLLFGISATIAGFGGAFLGSVNPRVSPTDFTTQLGLVWVAVVVTFGVRRPGARSLRVWRSPSLPRSSATSPTAGSFLPSCSVSGPFSSPRTPTACCRSSASSVNADAHGRWNVEAAHSPKRRTATSPSKGCPRGSRYRVRTRRRRSSCEASVPATRVSTSCTGSTSWFPRVRLLPSWGRTAPESRRCVGSRPAWWNRRPVPCSSTASMSRRCGRTVVPEPG